MRFLVKIGLSGDRMSVNAKNAKTLIKHVKAAFATRKNPKEWIITYCVSPGPWNTFYVCGKLEEAQGFSEIEDFFTFVAALDGNPLLADWVRVLYQLPSAERSVVVREYADNHREQLEMMMRLCVLHSSNGLLQRRIYANERTD